MAEANGLGMKLFGRKILLPQCQTQTTRIPVKFELMDTCNRTNMEGNQALDSGELEKSSCVADAMNKSQNLVNLDKQQADSKSEEDSTQNSTTTDEEKVFKKPDKILQCPRCNSLDTKFCYFNNYNVNQPRHFCKNCQRYWTAGGTMRNVPVGAGRRRNRHLASQFRQIIVSADSDNQPAISGLEHSAFRSSSGNGTVLRFGPDVPPLCESMETMLNLKDQKRCIDVGSVDHVESREEMCGSSLTTVGTQGTEFPVRVMQGEQVVLNEINTSRSMHCYPVSPWVLPWNPCWNSSTSKAAAHRPSGGEGSPRSSSPSSVPWYPMPVVAVPGICPPNMSLQFLPASCWGSMPLWPAGTGTISTGSNFCLPPTSATSNRCHSGSGSPTLGKHSRDTNFAEEKSDKCILVPKTLRMGDPIEASKSPIWTTYGINP